MTSHCDRAIGDAALAAYIFAVDPIALGGMRMRGRASSVRDRLLDTFQKLSAAFSPFRKLPLSIADDRLLGGIDLAATLKMGSPVLERGFLVSCNGGVVVAPGAERMSPMLAGRLAATLDAAEVAVEREGFSEHIACRFGLLVLDEGLETDEQPPALLLERLSLQVALPERLENAAAFDPTTLETARRGWRSVVISDAILHALCEAAAMLGVASARAPQLAIQVARIHAALNARAVAIDEDAAAAARLVYALRATMLPVEQAPAPADPPPQTEPEGTSKDEVEAALTDIVVEAARAALPPDLLARLLPQPALSRNGESGSSGRQSEAHRGRPVGSRAGEHRAGKRLHLIHTVRAAAPWQKLRRQADDDRRVYVTRNDFRLMRFRHESESLTLFVVDASGSSALHRLAEAKGAVELLLADCYVRRDQVALLAFRGKGAELLLPPTRSLPRAKRCLAGLPGGGGTPIASAIDMARLISEQARRKGRTPFIVLLTDGRGNVARDGSFGREAAETDALSAARGLRASQIACLVIDTSPSPHPAARKLAGDIQARYLPLPRADAATLSNAVRCAIIT